MPDVVLLMIKVVNDDVSPRVGRRADQRENMLPNLRNLLLAFIAVPRDGEYVLGAIAPSSSRTP